MSGGGGVRRYLPLALFAALGVVFAIQLYAPPGDTLDSVLIDAPAPEFDLAPLDDADPRFTTADLKTGSVSIVNLWASWCVPCRVEHPQLMALAESGVPIFGIAYRDEPAASRKFLEELGDPFTKVGVDPVGRDTLKWGIEGVPETFVLTGEGRVIYKHTGPIQNDDLETKILPAIRAAGGAG